MLRVRRIGAALAVAALVAGAGACGGPGPATTGLTRLWTVDQTAPGDPGSWFVDGMMVTGTVRGLTALSLRTGQAEWSWNSPAPPAGDYTAMTLTRTAGGIGLVSYSYLSETKNATTYPPSHETAIDLANGRPVWTRVHTASPYVAAPGYQFGSGVIAEIDESRDSKAATYVAASALATGRPAWSTESDPGLRGCDFSGLAISGALVYGVASCSGASVLYGLSARTGAVESRVVLEDRTCASSDGRPTLWAASGYLLVGCSEAELPRNQLLVLRPGSSHQSAVTYSSKVSSLAYPQGGPVRPAPFTLAGTTIYLETSPSINQDAIDAISLASGKRLWQRKPSGSVIGVTGSGVLTATKGDGSVSLAVMSAGSGAVSHGPGTTLKVPDLDNYDLTLVGHTLIANALNAQGSPIIAYGTGSWPRPA